MISEKDYRAALAIVRQYEDEENQRNRIILAHMSNDIRRYMKDNGNEDMQNFHLKHERGNIVTITFAGDWDEEVSGNEPYHKDLEKIGNEFGRSLRVPSYYYSK